MVLKVHLMNLIRDFSGNMEENPQLNATSRTNLNTEIERNDKTLGITTIDTGALPVVRSSFDTGTHAHIFNIFIPFL